MGMANPQPQSNPLAFITQKAPNTHTPSDSFGDAFRQFTGGPIASDDSNNDASDPFGDAFRQFTSNDSGNSSNTTQETASSVDADKNPRKVRNSGDAEKSSSLLSSGGPANILTSTFGLSGDPRLLNKSLLGG